MHTCMHTCAHIVCTLYVHTQMCMCIHIYIYYYYFDMLAQGDAAAQVPVPVEWTSLFPPLPQLARAVRLACPCVGVDGAGHALSMMGVRSEAVNVYDLIDGYRDYLLGRLVDGLGQPVNVANLHLGRRAGDLTRAPFNALTIPVDLLISGPPCPSFSVAGSRGGFQDPRGRVFVRVLQWVLYLIKCGGLLGAILENVRGICQSVEGRESIMARILRKMRSCASEFDWEATSSPQRSPPPPSSSPLPSTSPSISSSHSSRPVGIWDFGLTSSGQDCFLSFDGARAQTFGQGPRAETLSQSPSSPSTLSSAASMSSPCPSLPPKVVELGVDNYMCPQTRRRVFLRGFRREFAVAIPRVLPPFGGRHIRSVLGRFPADCRASLTTAQQANVADYEELIRQMHAEGSLDIDDIVVCSVDRSTQGSRRPQSYLTKNSFPTLTCRNTYLWIMCVRGVVQRLPDSEREVFRRPRHVERWMAQGFPAAMAADIPPALQVTASGNAFPPCLILANVHGMVQAMAGDCRFLSWPPESMRVHGDVPECVRTFPSSLKGQGRLLDATRGARRKGRKRGRSSDS